MTARIEIDREKIAGFCRKQKVREVARFGSALRGGFGPKSDVDGLVQLEPETPGGLCHLPLAPARPDSEP